MKFNLSQQQGVDILLNATKDLPIEHRAYILATAWHETAMTMQPIRERGGPKYFAKYEVGTKLGKALGNTIKGDGVKFIGRGYCQITGRANYARFSKLLGVDLISNPDLALDAKTAANIIVIGMTRGLFTGVSLSKFKDFAGMRRVVNGTDKAQSIAQYANSFMAYIKELEAAKPIAVEPPIPAPVVAPGKTDIPMTPKPKPNWFIALLQSIFGKKDA